MSVLITERKNRHDGEAGPASKQPTFMRCLGPCSLISLGISAIIGAGIFVLPGHVAATTAGPAVLLSFLIAAVPCAFAGLCYAEMAAAVPVAGSAYIYTRSTMGRLVAWIIGWDLILEYSLGATTVAIGWSGYVVSFLAGLGIHLPAHLTTPPFNLPAMLLVAAVTGLLIVGIETSSRVNNAIVALKLTVVALFILIGLGKVSTSHWGGHFIPPNTGQFGHFGWSGVLQGAATVFFAFLGFDVVSSAAQEARNPQRDMPIAILGSLAICAVLYALVSFVLTGVVDYQRLDVPDPIAVGTNAIGLGWLASVIKISIIIGLTSVVLVLLMGQSRIFWAMSRDQLLPQWAGRLHPRFHTPHIATALSGLFVMLSAGTLPIGLVGEMVSIGTLLAFAIVSAGVLVMRITQPQLARPFRVPMVWVVAPLGVLTSVALMLALPGETWARLIIWMAIGLVIYATYGRNGQNAAAIPADDSSASLLSFKSH